MPQRRQESQSTPPVGEGPRPDVMRCVEGQGSWQVFRDANEIKEATVEAAEDTVLFSTALTMETSIGSLGFSKL